ncbi:MAG: hypothetical protein H6672_21370 [Anaerolineaceae bacterium]|nr:hypothetical protein [Anaerolineaceae bacterium]
MSYLQYPLHLRFKLVALAPQIYVTDANGEDVLFVRQKILNLREDVRIFRDSSKSEEIYRINADRIIDFSANYHFTDSRTEQRLGSIKHKGMRSIWKATYLVSDDVDQQGFHINEDNPWAKVMDALLGEIPVLGMFTGYVFHPTYTAFHENTEKPAMRLEKKPSFFERSYEIHKLDDDLAQHEEQLLLLSFMMMIQLERSRG